MLYSAFISRCRDSAYIMVEDDVEISTVNIYDYYTRYIPHTGLSTLNSPSFLYVVQWFYLNIALEILSHKGFSSV